MNWIHPYQWVNITAPLTSGTTQRSPEILFRIVKQFQVETQARYRATIQDTYCNIFVSDVTRALACEIPHWMAGKEMTANAMFRWLANEDGKRNGWTAAMDAGEAVGFASRGYPVVVAFENKQGPGHIAIVLPSDKAVVEIAQAGRVNFERAELAKGFGSRTVRFFIHN